MNLLEKYGPRVTVRNEPLSWRAISNDLQVGSDVAKRHLAEVARALLQQSAYTHPLALTFVCLKKDAQGSLQAVVSHELMCAVGASVDWPPIAWLKLHFPAVEGFESENVYLESIALQVNALEIERNRGLQDELNQQAMLFAESRRADALYVPPSNDILLGELTKRTERRPLPDPQSGTTASPADSSNTSPPVVTSKPQPPAPKPQTATTVLKGKPKETLYKTTEATKPAEVPGPTPQPAIASGPAAKASEVIVSASKKEEGSGRKAKPRRGLKRVVRDASPSSPSTSSPPDCRMTDGPEHVVKPANKQRKTGISASQQIRSPTPPAPEPTPPESRALPSTQPTSSAPLGSNTTDAVPLESTTRQIGQSRTEEEKQVAARTLFDEDELENVWPMPKINQPQLPPVTSPNLTVPKPVATSRPPQDVIQMQVEGDAMIFTKTSAGVVAPRGSSVAKGTAQAPKRPVNQASLSMFFAGKKHA